MSWNVGFSLGGATPVLITVLASGAAGLPIALAVMTAAISLLYLGTLVFTPETRGGMRG